MQPVDSFLRSVRDAFHQEDDGSAWSWVGFGACLVLVGTWLVFRRWRLKERSRREFIRFLEGRHVAPTEVELLHRMAERSGLPARAIAEQIDVFERVTAQELKGLPVSLQAGEEGGFARVAALRRALGFATLGPHFAILTTRELEQGQIVEVAGSEATVTEVNEAWFAVTAPATTSLPVGGAGTSTRVTFVHGQEARYETRCVLLAHERGSGAHRLQFGHDEAPVRVQLRRSVRVTVRGPVRLDPVGAVVAAAGVASSEASTGELAADGPALDNASLLDISVGGAALDGNVHVDVGSLVQLSFELDGAAYRNLLATVLECSPRGRTAHHLRVEFRGLLQADEQRLAASVARHSAKPFTQPAS